MGWDGRIPGDGTIIRHAFDVENTSLYPGWWHTGENWFLDFDGNSAGAPVYAVSDGTVVFAGSDYPGRVVIIQHDGGIFSMYGHLDYALLVGEGDSVTRGQVIGRVLNKTDGRSPSHLHFEMRTFLIESIVNGDAPWYDYPCGYQCPPGPGYWPFGSELLPTEVGWLNPLHVIYGRAYGADIPTGAEVIASESAGELPFRDHAERGSQLDRRSDAGPAAPIAGNRHWRRSYARNRRGRLHRLVQDRAAIRRNRLASRGALDERIRADRRPPGNRAHRSPAGLASLWVMRAKSRDEAAIRA